MALVEAAYLSAEEHRAVELKEITEHKMKLGMINSMWDGNRAG